MAYQAKDGKPFIQTKWIRKYIESLHDPKIVTLTDRQYRTWDLLLLIAGKNGGILPSYRDLACDLRMTAQQVSDEVDELVNLGLIDVQQDGSGKPFLSPHNWSGRQFPSDHSDKHRMRKMRARKKALRNGDGEVTSRLQESDRICSESPSESVPEDRLDTEPRNGTTLSVGGTRVAARTGGKLNRYALAKNGGER